MPSIEQDFPIRTTADRVYAAVSEPAGLDEWWTLRSAGTPRPGALYTLDFGPEYVWRAAVRSAEPGRAFALEITEADADWTGTLVAFDFRPDAGGCAVQFRHDGWRTANAHFRTSAHCWALYLRILRRYLEHGEHVPYARRLEA